MSHEPDPAAIVAAIEAPASRQVTRWSGGSMAWRVWGSGRPVLLLHGASGSWTHWVKNVEALAAHFRVIVPDMPGFGDSDPAPEPHTAESLAEAVLAGLDDLVPAPAALDVVGFSLGGVIAGLVAARLGRRARTLVLVGPGGMAFDYPAPPALVRPSTRAASAEESRHVHRENLGRLMFGSPTRVDALAVFVQIQNIRRARFRTGDIPTSDALARALPAITARIAGIWGGRDAFVGPLIEESRRLLASYEHDLTARVVEHAGHWVTYEAAEEANAALLEILLRAES
jgi:pimeloyl-ACP methyl ester carboxylesterase